MKDDVVYLKHIMDTVLKIETYLEGQTFDDFQKNTLLQDGIIRGLEIIGEASAHLSDKSKNKLSKIKWPSIIAMRNKLIHEYFGVDLRIVWETVKEYLPNLKKIKKIFELNYS